MLYPHPQKNINAISQKITHLASHYIYLVNNVGVQQNHAEVVNNHRCVETEGLAVCHQARSDVHGEEDIGQQDGGHLHGALHQGVVSDSGIWKRSKNTPSSLSQHDGYESHKVNTGDTVVLG